MSHGWVRTGLDQSICTKKQFEAITELAKSSFSIQSQKPISRLSLPIDWPARICQAYSSV